ncbi:MAG TPA: hemin ABC transporter substrate-binding protein [Bacteroidetes bacterium]|nr:hemin ABC transporter substrate-binding protein [Bacteroidota bacterium]HIL58376.1 hemin ABC transporter substrate-binding protein [Rhodothermales bacterium]
MWRSRRGLRAAEGRTSLDLVYVTPRVLRLLSLLLALALIGCGAETSSEAAPDAAVSDSLRIVTLGGPVTETVYALGLGDRVVGTDQSSLYPAEILEKPRLNYFRQTSAEGVLSLQPTLVLALETSGPPGVIEQIRAAGVRVETVPEVSSVEEAEGRVQAIARLVGREAQAAGVIETMRAELAEATAAHPETAPRALFVYARGAGVMLVSGTGNAADAVLQLAGAQNAVTAFEDFQPLTAEAVVTAAPDVIVIPARGLESIGGVDGLLAQPGVAQTPAGQNRRIVPVDDALLLGFGPRIGQGAKALADSLGG